MAEARSAQGDCSLGTHLNAATAPDAAIGKNPGGPFDNDRPRRATGLA